MVVAAAWVADIVPAAHQFWQVFYIEAISNPLLKVADVAGVAAFSRQHGLTHVIDNTFATPVLLRPASMGYIVIHSATKFLNGKQALRELPLSVRVRVITVR